MLAVMIPPSIEERIASLAEKSGNTRRTFVRQPVLEILDRMERRYSIESRRA